MARVTVEDCIEQIPNRFDLVLSAAERARKLDRTDAQSPLDVENDKNTVVALREIAEGVSLDEAEQSGLLGEEDGAEVNAEEEGKSSEAGAEAEGEVVEAEDAPEDEASAEEKD